MLKCAFANKVNHYICDTNCGSSSGVEHQLPKLRVVGSNPISRSTENEGVR